MRFGVVARDAVDAAVQFSEFRVQVAKLDALGGATGGVVLGVEIQYQELILDLGQMKNRAPVQGREKSLTICFSIYSYSLTETGLRTHC